LLIIKAEENGRTMEGRYAHPLPSSCLIKETMIDTKICSHPDCGASKPLEDFWGDKRSKDGHQRYCKQCVIRVRKENRDKKKKGLVKPKEVRDIAKMKALVKVLPECNMQLEKAYSVVTGVASTEKAVYQWLENVEGDVMKQFKNHLASPSFFSQFEEYLSVARERALDTGNLGVWNDALRLWTQFIGIGSKIEISNPGKEAGEVKCGLEEMAKLLDEKFK
jgi:hypothetical protein